MRDTDKHEFSQRSFLLPKVHAYYEIINLFLWSYSNVMILSLVSTAQSKNNAEHRDIPNIIGKHRCHDNLHKYLFI